MSSLFALAKFGSPNDHVTNKKRLVRDTFVELIATTVFVNAGTLAAVSTGFKLVGQGGGQDVARIFPIAFAFGISIMVLAYSIGHLSGGHMNPAVSFLMALKREISIPKMICYWLAQFLGALLGATITWGEISGIVGAEKVNDVYQRPPFDLGSTTLNPTLTTGNGFLLELMGSFFFFFVIAQTALDNKGIGGSKFSAIPIGFSLIVVHICLIPFTGCGVNPARTFGPSMVVCMAGGNCNGVASGEWYWIYYTAPFLAAFLVAEVTAILEMNVNDGDGDTNIDNDENDYDNDNDDDNDDDNDTHMSSSGEIKHASCGV